MGYNKKFGTARPTTKEQSDFMKANKQEQLEKCIRSKAENWFWENYAKPYAKRTGLKVSRQSRRGFRLFDFRLPIKGIAIEIDGGYHDEQWKKEKDRKYDRYYFVRSAILTLRIPNRDDARAKEVMEIIEQETDRLTRRAKFGVLTKAQERKQ